MNMGDQGRIVNFLSYHVSVFSKEEVFLYYYHQFTKQSHQSTKLTAKHKNSEKRIILLERELVCDAHLYGKYSFLEMQKNCSLKIDFTQIS